MQLDVSLTGAHYFRCTGCVFSQEHSSHGAHVSVDTRTMSLRRLVVENPSFPCVCRLWTFVMSLTYFPLSPLLFFLISLYFLSPSPPSTHHSTQPSPVSLLHSASLHPPHHPAPLTIWPSNSNIIRLYPCYRLRVPPCRSCLYLSTQLQTSDNKELWVVFELHVCERQLVPFLAR